MKDWIKKITELVKKFIKNFNQLLPLLIVIAIVIAYFWISTLYGKINNLNEKRMISLEETISRRIDNVENNIDLKISSLEGKLKEKEKEYETIISTLSTLNKKMNEQKTELKRFKTITDKIVENQEEVLTDKEFEKEYNQILSRLKTNIRLLPGKNIVLESGQLRAENQLFANLKLYKDFSLTQEDSLRKTTKALKLCNEMKGNLNAQLTEWKLKTETFQLNYRDMMKQRDYWRKRAKKKLWKRIKDGAIAGAGVWAIIAIIGALK